MSLPLPATLSEDSKHFSCHRNFLDAHTLFASLYTEKLFFENLFSLPVGYWGRGVSRDKIDLSQCLFGF